MKIAGLQKTSLLDYPGKMCATIFTKGCNLRCPFCHNRSLVFWEREGESEEFEEQDILAFLKKRTGLLDGVCITGGEPLLQQDLSLFLRQIKELGFLIKLDTNGFFSEIMKNLIQDGLIDYVAMDIKNSPQKYEKTVGISSMLFSKVEESVDLLMTGSTPYEFRTTVVKEFHQEEDFTHIGKWLSGAQAYFLQSFVDSGDVIQPGLHSWEEEKMHEFKSILLPYISTVQLRGI